LRADLAAEPVRATVACEFGAADGVAEARWVQRRRDLDGWPGAFIAAVDLTAPDLGDTLARYAELPVVAAVRQPLYWAEDPLRRLGARPDFLTDSQWRRGFERVAEHGLTWDLLVYDEQIPAAEPLIRAYPQTQFVLEATGWPLNLTPEGFSRWQERMQRLSSLPNVVVKLQGLALVFGPSREAIGPWVREAVTIFGAGRCMFASHFPVDRLLWSFHTLVSTLREVLTDLPPEDRHEFFAGVASRTYRPQPAHDRAPAT
jgi:predicted TIM-barrel fold metal-dependent hydrolase